MTKKQKKQPKKQLKKPADKPQKADTTPYKFSPEKKSEILACFANGYEKYVDIAQLTGLHHETVSDWIRAGKITQAEIFKARNSAKLKAQGIVFDMLDRFKKNQTHVKGDTIVKTALWWLERKYPDEFAAKIEQKIKIETQQKTAMLIIEVVRNEIKDPAILQRISAGLRARLGEFDSASSGGDDGIQDEQLL